jgi:hypothetical protein
MPKAEASCSALRTHALSEACTHARSHLGVAQQKQDTASCITNNRKQSPSSVAGLARVLPTLCEQFLEQRARRLDDVMVPHQLDYLLQDEEHEEHRQVPDADVRRVV